MVHGRPCRLLKLVKRHCSADPMDPGIASPSGIFIGSCTKVRVRLPAEKPCTNVSMIPLLLENAVCNQPRQLPSRPSFAMMLQIALL